MARPGFLNDNLFRAYPFIPPSAVENVSSSAGDEDTLPTVAIVDFGAIMGLDAMFDDVSDCVYLYEIRRSGDTFTFEFRTNADAAEPYVLLFARDVSDEEFAFEQVEAAPAGTSSSSASSAGDCGESPIWEGFLVTGNLAELAEELADGATLTFTGRQLQIEPARIQNLESSFVRSVGLANFDRTHTIATDACGGSDDGEEPVFVYTACLDGALRLMEGFNCAIRQEDSTNTLTVSAALGAGVGLACEEMPIYEGEAPPEGSTLLTGGPSCTEILKTINGVGGRVIRLFGGKGVHIAPHESEANKLVVDVDLAGFVVCLDE